MYQLLGPFDIEVEFDEKYSERNIDGARIISNFKFTSEFDGSYELKINNKLTIDKEAKQTIHLCLPNKLEHFDMLDYRKRKRQIREKHKLNKDLKGKLMDNISITEKGLIVNYYDLSFEDDFVDKGNMNDRYDDEKHLEKLCDVPNYIDAMDLEKYTINLKRTYMTGKH
jgi:hypothetical protein